MKPTCYAGAESDPPPYASTPDLAGVMIFVPIPAIDAGGAPQHHRAMPSPFFVVEIAVEPRSRTDRAALSDALHRLLERDASLGATEDEECWQTIIRAGDECQLSAAINQLQLDTGSRLNVGAPQVAYRESLAKKVDVDYTHKKQSGGSGQFGRIKFTVEPGERGQGVIFKDEVKGGNVPKEYIPSVEKGIREIAATGSLIGFPIIDFTATLYDGAYHDVDSSALASRSPAAAACARPRRRPASSCSSRS